MLKRLITTLFIGAAACTSPDIAPTSVEDVALFDTQQPDESADLKPSGLRQTYSTFGGYPSPPSDPSNRVAENEEAAKFGQKLFFDTRFSGPLLDTDNNGQPGTLGEPGETGKVACASCHVPSQFVDTRTTRSQISLAAGWTRRKTPSLLDVAHVPLLTWSGRRDSVWSQVFSPVEKAVEMNSSRLFVAQQIEELYKDEYEAILARCPTFLGFERLAASDAGCSELPGSPHAVCEKPFDDT